MRGAARRVILVSLEAAEGTEARRAEDAVGRRRTSEWDDAIWPLPSAICPLPSAICSHPFLRLDDPDYVLENDHVNNGLSLSNIEWAFRAMYASNWHPLTWISH